MIYIKIVTESVGWKDQTTNTQNRRAVMLPSYTELQGIVHNFWTKPEIVMEVKEFGYINPPTTYSMIGKTCVLSSSKHLYGGSIKSNNITSSILVRHDGNPIEFYVGVNIVPLSLKMNKDDAKDSPQYHIIKKNEELLKRKVSRKDHIHTLYCGATHCPSHGAELLDKRPETAAVGVNVESSVLMSKDNNNFVFDNVKMSDGVCYYDTNNLKQNAPNLYCYERAKAKWNHFKTLV